MTTQRDLKAFANLGVSETFGLLSTLRTKLQRSGLAQFQFELRLSEGKLLSEEMKIIFALIFFVSYNNSNPFEVAVWPDRLERKTFRHN